MLKKMYVFVIFTKGKNTIYFKCKRTWC